MSSSKNLPAQYDQMLEAGQAKRSASRIYKVEAAEFQNEQISQIVNAGFMQLAQIADTAEKVRLADSATVKSRSLLYIRSCAETSSLPSFAGLLLSMGLTPRAGYSFMQRNSTHETSEWLEICKEAFSEMLTESASRGLTNTIYSIFIQKARFGLTENNRLEIVPAADPLGNRMNAADLAEKYKNIPLD